MSNFNYPKPIISSELIFIWIFKKKIFFAQMPEKAIIILKIGSFKGLERVLQTKSYRPWKTPPKKL